MKKNVFFLAALALLTLVGCPPKKGSSTPAPRASVKTLASANITAETGVDGKLGNVAEVLFAGENMAKHGATPTNADAWHFLKGTASTHQFVFTIKSAPSKTGAASATEIKAMNDVGGEGKGGLFAVTPATGLVTFNAKDATVLGAGNFVVEVSITSGAIGAAEGVPALGAITTALKNTFEFTLKAGVAPEAR
jgi:hypothetical protein